MLNAPSVITPGKLNKLDIFVVQDVKGILGCIKDEQYIGNSKK